MIFFFLLETIDCGEMCKEMEKNCELRAEGETQPGRHMKRQSTQMEFLLAASQ